MFESQYGLYRTNTFVEVFPNKQKFREYYEEVGLGGFQKEETLGNLWTLLYARRGNDAVLSSDQQRFVYNLFSIVFKYGPDFEKKMELQKKIRSLTEEELSKGTTAIYNHADNPSTIPTSQDFEQLHKIDSQTATGYKKARVDSLMLQYDAMNTRYIEEFLRRFDNLFSPFPAEIPLYYYIEGEQEV